MPGEWLVDEDEEVDEVGSVDVEVPVVDEVDVTTTRSVLVRLRINRS